MLTALSKLLSPSRPQTGEIDTNWWKSTSIYQIWPTSFKDSTGTGVGDIPGITSKLPYLKSLGVEAIWLSPVYKSPQHDMGYDISDYEDIHAAFGTLEDMQTLIDKAHEMNLKVLMDLVINHTSNEHAWFQESMKSKDDSNKKKDWYIWRAPKYVDGVRHPPNNWRAAFGGSAWDYVAERDEYYLHLFLKEQPDLNWQNEETRQAIYNSAMRFWLKRGVDGFRIDTCNIYDKPQDYPDAPVKDPAHEWQQPWELVCDGPNIHKYLREMNDVCDEFGDIMTVGELGLTADREALMKYIRASRKELKEIFEFKMLMLGRDFFHPEKVVDYKLSELKETLVYSQGLKEGTGAWTTTFSENHDAGRSVSRFATRDPKWHDRASKLLATMIATMSGTLFLYQGQEIGMTNIPESWPPEEYRDIDAINSFEDFRKRFPNDPEKLKELLHGINTFGRDNARTPVQWDDSKHAGFTTGTPWMRVNDNYTEINVAAQVNDESSVLSFWRKLLKLRSQHKHLLVFGEFEVMDKENECTFTYHKNGDDGKKALVQLNFTAEEQEAFNSDTSHLLISNVENTGEKLAPWEARLQIIG